MPPRSRPPGAGAAHSLTIGELSRATGLSAATLRSWEERHGFPQPLRLGSGHRRYSRADVEAVLDVRRRQDAGVRLDVAMDQVRAVRRSSNRPSVYARTTRAHPGQPHQRLRKSTLVAVSRAIEDEAVATAQHAHLFASFQEARHYRAVEERWSEIARVVASAHVFADFETGGDGESPVQVPLGDNAPMLREWALVCDAPDLPVALLAWEPPGQAATSEQDRTFEAVWTVDAVVVRDAARWCAEAAAGAGSRRAAELLVGPLAGPPPSTAPSPLATGRLVQRILRDLEADAPA